MSLAGPGGEAVETREMAQTGFVTLGGGWGNHSGKSKGNRNGNKQANKAVPRTKDQL